MRKPVCAITLVLLMQLAPTLQAQEPVRNWCWLPDLSICFSLLTFSLSQEDAGGGYDNIAVSWTGRLYGAGLSTFGPFYYVVGFGIGEEFPGAVDRGSSAVGYAPGEILETSGYAGTPRLPELPPYSESLDDIKTLSLVYFDPAGDRVGYTCEVSTSYYYGGSPQCAQALSVVPEPSTVSLLGLGVGLMALALGLRRRTESLSQAGDTRASSGLPVP